MAGRGDFALAGLVNLAGQELVALGIELVGGVVADGGQCLDDGGLGGGRRLGRGRGLQRRGLMGQRRVLRLGGLHGGRGGAVRRRGRGRRLGGMGGRGGKGLLDRATALFPLGEVVCGRRVSNRVRVRVRV